MARSIALRDAIREAMSEEMRRDETVFLMGEEVAEYNGAYKVSKGMLDEFGSKRVIDTPISELGFAGIGVGAAMNGLRPIIEFMTWNFAVLAFDQIVNNAAKTLSQSAGEFNCPIVFRGPSGSAGQLAQQHSQTFESWMANVPGLKVISCIDPYDSKGLMKSAIRDNDPVCIMEAETQYGLMGEVPEGEYLVPIGVAAVRKEGTDVTIVSYNKMMLTALEAAEQLEKEGISAEVIDCEFLGNHSLVHLQTGDFIYTADLKKDLTQYIGETVDFYIDMSRVHFFNPETEERIRLEGGK